MENKNEFIKLYCPGCGALLQNDDPLKSGFVPKKLEAKSNFLCQRCFRLQHYGEAYEDIHYSNDYQTIISKAKQSDALIVYVVEAAWRLFWCLPQRRTGTASDGETGPGTYTSPGWSLSAATSAGRVRLGQRSCFYPISETEFRAKSFF